jgi:hypothetical protein
MPNAPEDKIGHDLFVNLAVTIGPKFYGEKRPGTNEEIAEVLRSHAAHFDGLLRELFTVLEKYYRTQVGLRLNPLAEAPDPTKAGATGGHTGGANVTFGNCGGCTPQAGEKGYWMYVNGQKQSCIPC